MLIPPLLQKGDYIYGSFIKPEMINGYIKSSDPSNKDALIGQYFFSYSSVSQAIAYAKASLTQWQKKSIESRIVPIQKLQEDIVKNHQFITKTISLESGSPLHEASSEVNESILFLQYLIDASPSILDEIQQKKYTQVPAPLGCLFVLTPHVHSFFYGVIFCASALITGNVVVHKPSRYTPAIGQLVAEIWDRCSLKRGVYNMVQGPGTHISQQVMKNTLLDGIVFCGEYDTANSIHRRTPVHLPLRLFCGGKGTGIILSDADIDDTSNTVIAALTRSGGQSPYGLSRIFVHESIIEDVLETIENRLKNVHISPPNGEQPSQLGPLISEQALSQYIQQGESIEKEGHKAICPAQKHTNDTGFFVFPSMYRMYQSSKDLFLDIEVKGPTLLVYTFAQEQDVVGMIKKISYRRSLSIFSQRESTITQEKINFGRICYNKTHQLPIVSTMPHGKCGNGHREGLGIVRSLIQYINKERIP